MRSISGCLPPRAGSCGDEEDVRVYWKDEAYSAAGLPLSRDLECTLDGGGGDTHPVGEGALTDLDCHPYHSVSLLLRFSTPVTGAHKHHSQLLPSQDPWSIQARRSNLAGATRQPCPGRSS